MTRSTMLLFQGAICLLFIANTHAKTVLVPTGSTWKYFETNPGPNWMAPSFDDSLWPSGPGSLGFGDQRDTFINQGAPSYAFRTRFSVNLSSLSSDDSLSVRLLRDDGAVVYLNGQEILRSNMPAGAIGYNTLAAGSVGGVDEISYFPFLIGKDQLVDGENVIAVSVHQSALSSSDVGFDLELSAVKVETPPVAVESAKLTASDVNSANKIMGYTIATDGDTYFFGAEASSFDRGSVYVFVPSTERPGEYVESKQITGSDVDGRFSGFARSAMKADNGTLAVGADQDTVIAANNFDYSDAGAVYIFERDSGGPQNWGQTSIVTASDPGSNRFFGRDLDLNGDTLVVGATGGGGAVYVFERQPDSSWMETKKILPDGPESPTLFGEAVEISGDLLAIGVPQTDGAGQPRGWVSVHERNEGGANNWGRIAVLVAPSGPTINSFGMEVEMEGDRIAVATLRHSGVNNSAGKVFIFERDAGGTDQWGVTAELSTGINGELFGTAMEMRGDYIMVGAWYLKNAYLFGRNFGGENNWGLGLSLSPSDDGDAAQTGNRFGYAVAMTDKHFLVGARDMTAGLNRAGGAVYLFNHTAELPVFGKPLLDTTRLTGQAVTFDADAAGPGALTYQWLLDDSPINGETGSSLTLTPSATSDSGFYSVTATNSFGASKSNAGFLTVIESQSDNPALQIGTDARQATNGDQFTLGYVFTVDEPLYISHLGMLDTESDGTNFVFEVGLWDRAAQTLLSQVEFRKPGTAEYLDGFYRYAPVEPQLLQPGRQYIVAMFSQFEYPVTTSDATQLVSPDINVVTPIRIRTNTMQMPTEERESGISRIQANFRFTKDAPAELLVRSGPNAGDPPVAEGEGEKEFFAPAAIGPGGSEKTFRIENPGGQELSLTSFSIPYGFDLVGEFPSSIAAGESYTFTLRFNSPTPGTFGGIVRFASSDLSRSPYSFAVTIDVVIPDVEVSTALSTVDEDQAGTLAIEVKRSGPVQHSLTIPIAIAGDAAQGDDYSLQGVNQSAGEVVIAAGSAIAEISITVVPDNLVEASEIISLPLGAGDLFNLSPGASALEIEIQDDDFAPVAVPDGPITLIEDSRLLTGNADGVLANDMDEDDGGGAANLSAELITSTTNGVLVLGTDGAIDYHPDADYFGPDQFTYRATDGTNFSEATTVSLQVLEQVNFSLIAAESRDPVLAGLGGSENLMHTLTVTNDGPSNATNVRLHFSHTLPAGASLLGVTQSTGSTDEGEWTIPVLAENASASLVFVYHVPNTVEGGTDSISSVLSVIDSSQPRVETDDDSTNIATSVLSSASIANVALEVIPGLTMQTGMFTQHLEFTNNNTLAISGFRILVGGTLNAYSVHTATGFSSSGAAYFDHLHPIAPGETVTIPVEFFNVSRSGDLQPSYTIELLPDNYIEQTAPPGARFAIDRLLKMEEGSLLIEWPSEAGSIYVVEYSDDMSTWKVAGAEITAGGNRTQWIDDGPPKTSTHPSQVATRYYRVVMKAEAGL